VLCCVVLCCVVLCCVVLCCVVLCCVVLCCVVWTYAPAQCNHAVAPILYINNLILVMGWLKLVTFDATGTLLRLRGSVGERYVMSSTTLHDCHLHHPPFTNSLQHTSLLLHSTPPYCNNCQLNLN
jgi:hypothetical protein